MSARSNYKDVKDLSELKEKAITYYQANCVPEKMEEILNIMFFENPDDVYGYLATYFGKFMKPAIITKLTACQVLDGRGQSTIQIQVFCNISNTTKLFSTCVSPSSNTHLMDNAHLEERVAEEQRKGKSVKMAVTYIEEEISDKLKGMKPTQQAEMDTIIALFLQTLKEKEEALKEVEKADAPPEEVKPPLTSPKDKKGKGSAKARGKATNLEIIPEDPPETFVQGAELACAVSQAVCVAGAFSLGLPVYQHIASIYNAKAAQLRMPLPVVTIMQSGKSAPGKLNCIKEFMIIPSPKFSFAQTLDYITGIYSHVEKAISIKGGVISRNVNEYGSLCPVFDKPEQGLDLLMEAITGINLTPGEDIHIAINAAAHEILDFDKGKYEVAANQLKTFDDMVEFWAELLSRYPAIALIIDPIRKQEKQQWMQLSGRITEHCFMAGSKMYPRAEILKDLELEEPAMTGAAILSFQNHTSVSDLCAAIKKLEKAENQIILNSCAGETQDDFIADLAVAMNVRFIKLGAPNRGERISKFNRLLQIENELAMDNKLAPQTDHEFKHLAPPPAEETEIAANSPVSPKKEGKKK